MKNPAGNASLLDPPEVLSQQAVQVVLVSARLIYLRYVVRFCYMAPHISELEFARRCFEFAWFRELLSVSPDWMKLFEIHYELVSVERRLRLLRRAA